MDDRKSRLAVEASLQNGITGWLNNITEWEKHQTAIYLEGSCKFVPLVFSPEKIINNAVLIIRSSHLIRGKGIEAVFMIDQLFWGLYKDGKNTPISYERARDLTEEIMKGEE